MKKRITVLLADDHMIVREGLRSLLEAEGDIEVIGEAETGRAAVAMAARRLPDVILMDIAMPMLNGLEAARQILHDRPLSRILVLSAHNDSAYLDRANEIGVAGFLIKQTSASVLVDAVRSVALGGTFFSPPSAPRRPSTNRRPPSRARSRLTSRETEVLQLIAEGMANKQTASELGISIKTVEKHRQGLMDKLNLHDTAGLTRHAIAMGIIESGVRASAN